MWTEIFVAQLTFLCLVPFCAYSDFLFNSAAPQPNQMPRELHAAVVGAGVGGVAAVGALVAAGVRMSWVDPAFSAGAFANYGDVPANTKVALLAPHFEALVPQGVQGEARRALEALKSNAFSLELAHDPDAGEGWCGLDAVHDVLRALTEDVLLPSDGVRGIVGRVTALRQRAEGAGWTVEWTDGAGVAGEPLDVDVAVLATGCAPAAVPAALLPRMWAAAADAVRVVPLEEALQLSALRDHVAAAGGGVVGVVGAGHSGVVVARMLLGLPSVERVRLFARRPVKLAAWDLQAGRYGAWGFRGLKGAAAELAVKHGLVDADPPNGPVTPGSRLELWDAGALATDARAAHGMRSVIYCLGYARAALPPIALADGTAAEATGSEPGAGRLCTPQGRLSGLYGAGLAFAEDEQSSGAPYPEASLKAFRERAHAIAQDCVSAGAFRESPAEGEVEVPWDTGRVR